MEGLRFEELPDEWFDYNIAFPTVTGFYGSASTESTGDTSSSELDSTRMAEGTILYVCVVYMPYPNPAHHILSLFFTLQLFILPSTFPLALSAVLGL